MGQVFSAEEFEKLNPKSLIKWDEIVDAEFQQNWSWEVNDASSPLNQLSAQSRLFYPRSFSVSPSFSALSSPWYIDYGHLMFWFFFLSTFLIVMWIVTLHSLTSRNVETRFPRRETRGFSRAQTGDVMTAVLPLTWSITMLMHASTHSINFDENTAATVFSFTVVAYQWGWNYYFPRDIVDKLARGPRIVGRGGIDLNKNHSDYNLLLERARYDYMARLAARGLFSEKNGKEVMSNILSLYARAGNPSQTMALQSEVQLLTSAYNLASWTHSADVNALWYGTSFNAPTAYKNPSSLNLPAASASWLLSSFGKARYFAIDSDPKAVRSFLKLAYPSITQLSQQTKTFAPFNHLTKLTFSAKHAQPLRYVGNTTRSLPSLSLLGNRLGLIHKHLATSVNLPTHLTSKRQIAFKLLSLVNKDKSFTFIHNRQPVWTSHQPSSIFSKENIIPNLWFLSKNPGVIEGLVEKLTPKSLLPFKLKTRATKLLNFTNNLKPSNSYFGYVRLAHQQKNLYSGAPYSLAAKSTNLITIDDLGVTNSSVLKELTTKLLSQSTIANTFTLKQTLAQSKPLVIKNFALQAQGNANIKLLNTYLASKNYNFTESLTQLPTAKSKDRFGWFLHLTALNHNARTNKQLWYTSILPRSTAATSRHDLTVWCNVIPSTSLRGISLEAKVVSPSFFSKSYLTRNTMTAKSLLTNAVIYNPSTNQIFALRRSNSVSLVGLTLISNLKPLLLQKHYQVLRHSTVTPALPLNLKVLSLPTVSRNITVSFVQDVQHKLLLASKPILTSFKKTRIHAKPLWSANTALQVSPVWPGLLVTKAFPAKPVVSMWLEGPTDQRPVRSSADRTADVVNFAGKANAFANQPFFANNALTRWTWAWTNNTLTFASPLYKFQRGGFVKKPITGFWQQNDATHPLSLSTALLTSSLRVDKGSFFTEVTDATFTKNFYMPNLTSFALIDSEWSLLAQTPAIITPEPGEDVDQAFNHQKWTIDINSTRRSDHNSKFKVTWGPWASLKKAKLENAELSVAANVYGGVTGVSSVQGLPLRVTQKIALFNETTLPFKTSTGLTQVMATSNGGDINLASPQNPRLLNTLRPRSVISKSGLFNTKQAKLANRLIHQNHAKYTPLDITPWSQFWTFKQKVDDSILMRQRVNTDFAPSYWTDKALLALNNKRLQETRLVNAAIHTPTKVSRLAVGAGHPLLFDLKVAANYDGRFAYSTSPQSWISSYNESTLGLLLSKCAITLENTVESHLISRANYSLALDEIGSIRRLRVTKGVYLPSDVPMHVVCGSKDVIHSWALPGLNIKIDCIPGFNSHRRLLLRWRGAYWGQCMEVCGRYHHWMPILIHVVHKDIFLSWCLAYLRLVDAKANEASKGLALIATIDLLALDSTLSSLLTDLNNLDNSTKNVNAFLVSSDLDE